LGKKLNEPVKVIGGIIINADAAPLKISPNGNFGAQGFY
jgi:hypothetical protein